MGNNTKNCIVGTQKVLVKIGRRYHLKYEALKAVEYFKNDNPVFYKEKLIAFFTQSCLVS